MSPLTTVTISAPTAPPNNPSSNPMLRPSSDWNRQDWNQRFGISASESALRNQRFAGLERKCRLKRKREVDGGYRVELLERAGRMSVVRDAVTNTEAKLFGHLYGQRNVIVQQRIGRACFRQEFIRQRGGFGKRVQEIQAGGADCFAGGIMQNAIDHDTVRILDDVFGPQSTVACTDLAAQLGIHRIDELVAHTCGHARLVLETVEHIVFKATSTKGEQSA